MKQTKVSYLTELNMSSKK